MTVIEMAMCPKNRLSVGHVEAPLNC